MEDIHSNGAKHLIPLLSEMEGSPLPTVHSNVDYCVLIHPSEKPHKLVWLFELPKGLFYHVNGSHKYSSYLYYAIRIREIMIVPDSIKFFN